VPTSAGESVEGDAEADAGTLSRMAAARVRLDAAPVLLARRQGNGPPADADDAPDTFDVDAMLGGAATIPPACGNGNEAAVRQRHSLSVARTRAPHARPSLTYTFVGVRSGGRCVYYRRSTTFSTTVTHWLVRRPTTVSRPFFSTATAASRTSSNN
jgi:hypothetical protein